jgi:3-oxoacyl-[acyl-carrier protein] reductase
MITANDGSAKPVVVIPDLVGKVVLVTGSSTGIGAAVALGFARSGAKVAVHYNASADAAEAVVAEIRAAGGNAQAFGANVTKTSAVESLMVQVYDHFGALHVLVNNAGGLVERALLAETDDQLYDRVLDLNVRSVMSACRYAVPYLKQSGGGSIINTGSIVARHGGGPGVSLYGGAKAFVEAVTRNLAKEFATSGIRVNAVAPGVILTPFHDRHSTAEGLENFRRGIPMARLGTAEECVGAYLFLASEILASYIPGQVIEVNGGQIMP